MEMPTDPPTGPVADYLSPTRLDEALTILAGGSARPLAGGVEWARRAGTGEALGTLVDLGGIAELDRLFAHPKIGLSIGASVRLRALGADIWVAKRWAALHEAVEQIVPPQLHNMATVVGNLCAADPCYDLPVALATHRAWLRIEAARAAPREVAITDFYPSPGLSVLRPGELVTAILAPRPSPDAGSAFRKIGAGSDKVCAAAYVALDTVNDRIVEVSLAVSGATGPIRLLAVEAAMPGLADASGTYAEAAAHAMEALDGAGAAPADTVRRRWLQVLMRDALEQAASRARSRHDPFDDHASLMEER
ncbi:FAD binding domain-containing protein [Ancylobacter sp. WKF20]|uniref:FAD binding domain-containing protein n=1 Tax=Ancylobacter sp. WKF20 TaxID=3039801 RepID=UPI0024344A5F|nr:FAD binding domain-containing protein [Ancylobacter sp. WKF20]WGD29729.1 FAD binding domain-containing protein [Ancylobacter sp. WKF20]